MQLIHAYVSPQQDSVPLPNWVFTLSWNNNSNRLASAHMDFAVRIWDLRQADDDNPTTTLEHQKFAVAVGWSPQGDVIASSDAHSNNIYLWDTRNGSKIGDLTEHIGWPYGIEFSPDGKLLATGGADGRVLLWNVATKELVRTLWQFRNQDERGIGFHSLGWSPDGNSVIAISTEGMMYLWSVPDWKLRVFQIPQMNRMDASLAWSPDGHRVALLPSNGDVLIVDVSGKPRLVAALPCELPEASNERFRAIDWSRDGTRIVVSRGTNEIMVYDRGRPTPTFFGNMIECTALAWSPDNHLLASGDNEGAIHIWQRA